MLGVNGLHCRVFEHLVFIVSCLWTFVILGRKRVMIFGNQRCKIFGNIRWERTILFWFINHTRVLVCELIFNLSELPGSVAAKFLNPILNFNLFNQLVAKNFPINEVTYYTQCYRKDGLWILHILERMMETWIYKFDFILSNNNVILRQWGLLLHFYFGFLCAIAIKQVLKGCPFDKIPLTKTKYVEIDMF